MTYHTAYSVQPRPSTLPERKAASFEKQMASDDALKRMLADAKTIKARNYALHVPEAPVEAVPEAEILAFIAKHPGCNIVELAEGVGRSTQTLRSRMSSMEVRQQVRVRKYKHPKSHRMMRKFYPVENPPKAKNGRPKGPQDRPAPVRDKAIAFIRANPGCTTPQLAEHMGRSCKKTGAILSHVRQVVNLHSERPEGIGNHVPARHWILED